jgi:hypothetical protein
VMIEGRKRSGRQHGCFQKRNARLRHGVEPPTSASTEQPLLPARRGYFEIRVYGPDHNLIRHLRRLSGPALRAVAGLHNGWLGGTAGFASAQARRSRAAHLPVTDDWFLKSYAPCQEQGYSTIERTGAAHLSQRSYPVS